jgi:predicted phage tail protein
MIDLHNMTRNQLSACVMDLQPEVFKTIRTIDDAVDALAGMTEQAGFFVLNGAIALALALWASAGLRSLYTGVISYGSMGLLFAAGYAVRLRFKRLHHA